MYDFRERFIFVSIELDDFLFAKLLFVVFGDSFTGRHDG
jgi:hypothetical protein